MNAAYMVAAGAIVAGLSAVGMGLALQFAVLGVLSIAVLFYVMRAWGVELPSLAGKAPGEA
jgi:hypothetical protein